MAGDEKCKLKLLIGSPKLGGHMEVKEAQGMMILPSTLTEQAQTSQITDCHIGNPCEIVCDPRVIINSPMIRRSYGYDKKERLKLPLLIELALMEGELGLEELP
ncbi:hypothetical protein Tco_0144327 [Tanacetum coccineum]